MQRIPNLILLLVLTTFVTLSGCDEFFGTKEDDITNEIFEEGRIDPLSAEDVVGYAALLPFWDGFDEPQDIIIGYDELAYVVDNRGVTVLDRAGRAYNTYPLRGANAITMDRNLFVYVSARIDYELDVNGVPTTFDLPAVFKIKGLNGTQDIVVADTIVFPFDDASMSTFSAQIRRLDRSRADNYEQVQITGVATLGDNSLYVTRTGPSNAINRVEVPDNIVLEFTRVVENGELTEKMRNVRQIRTLSPTIPSLISGIGLSSIATFIGPPQREVFPNNRSFIVAQADTNTVIPYRVLWINAVETVDGLIFEPNPGLLENDTSKASGFLYEPGKFTSPADVIFTTDGTNYILVVDSAKDSLYLFDSGGLEGVPPPLGSNETKQVKVSFGGRGTGAKEFNEPSGVAYFREVVFVADRKNNRISRFKLTTDFE